MYLILGTSLYEKMKKYIMKEDELRENGFPRKQEQQKGHAIIYGSQKATVSTIGEKTSTTRLRVRSYYNLRSSIQNEVH